jgi:hypothetical protein
MEKELSGNFHLLLFAFSNGSFNFCCVCLVRTEVGYQKRRGRQVRLPQAFLVASYTKIPGGIFYTEA